MKVRIEIEVDARIESDGSVGWVSPLESRELCRAVTEQVPAEDRIAIYKHATRSRLDEGLVRIWQGRHLSYHRLVKRTKRHIILSHNEHPSKWKRTGYRVGASGYHLARIDSGDLEQLLKAAP